MTRGDHPSDLMLVRWTAGEGDFLAEHLTACDLCAERAAAAGISVGAEAQTTPEDRARAGLLLPRIAATARHPALRLRRVAALAAAALLAAWGVCLWIDRHDRRPGSSPAAPAVPRPAAFASVISNDGPVPVERVLPDGSRVWVAPGARFSFVIGPDGSRRLKLDTGSVTLDVRKDRSLFVVSAAAGDVIVTGTRFAARAFRLEPPGHAAVPILAAEVREGHVRLRSEGGIADLAAGQTGLAAGRMPVRLTDSADRPEAVAAALGLLAAAENGTAAPALLAAAATILGTLDDPRAFLEEAAASPDPRRRTAGAALARLAGIPADGRPEEGR